MFRRLSVAVIAIFVFVQLASSQVPPPKPKGKPRPSPSKQRAPDAFLLLACDEPCLVTVDGDMPRNLSKEKTARVPTIIGQHLVIARSVDVPDVVSEQLVEVKEKGQMVVSIKLAVRVADARAARAHADGNRARVLERQSAGNSTIAFAPADAAISSALRRHQPLLKALGLDVRTDVRAARYLITLNPGQGEPSATEIAGVSLRSCNTMMSITVTGADARIAQGQVRGAATAKTDQSACAEAQLRAVANAVKRMPELVKSLREK